MTTTIFHGTTFLIDALVNSGLTPNHSESRRMLNQGAVKIDGSTVHPNTVVMLNEGFAGVITIGKRRTATVKVVGE